MSATRVPYVIAYNVDTYSYWAVPEDPESDAPRVPLNDALSRRRAREVAEGLGLLMVADGRAPA